MFAYLHTHASVSRQYTESSDMSEAQCRAPRCVLPHLLRPASVPIITSSVSWEISAVGAISGGIMGPAGSTRKHKGPHMLYKMYLHIP